ncbi:unnamed protein product [Vitrella brassicaformis CCMP3155]|uniref:Uncharacterized protein n=1 Tax=Vitrella brassicaformis (strain CCMP3155) TaxID=1169540 RepID=A0A0G4EB75_VITBC|nr:unnamed protein product [Vitrella brassicaformis CCMP3155]|eukprot:CEL92514.1 unnamed protein product [Vitrella brassicaformis CCMP3155]
MSIELQFSVRFYDKRSDRPTFRQPVTIPPRVITFNPGIRRSQLQDLIKTTFPHALDGYDASELLFPDHQALTADDVIIDATSFPSHGGADQDHIRVEAGLQGGQQGESEATRKRRRLCGFYLWLPIIFLVISIFIYGTSGQHFHGGFWSGFCLAVALLFVGLILADLPVADSIDRYVQGRYFGWCLLDCPDWCGCFRDQPRGDKQDSLVGRAPCWKRTVSGRAKGCEGGDCWLFYCEGTVVVGWRVEQQFVPVD